MIHGTRAAVPAGAQNEMNSGRAGVLSGQRTKNRLFVLLLSRRTTVAPQLIADPRIGVGAENIARHVVPVRWTYVAAAWCGRARDFATAGAATRETTTTTARHGRTGRADFRHPALRLVSP